MARVRDAVAAVNTTIALQHRAAATAKPASNVGLTRERWVAEQLRFYSVRAIRRKRSSAYYLVLIVAAFGTGLGIVANLLAHLLHVPAQLANGIAIAVAVISVVPFLLRFRTVLLREDGRKLWLLAALDGLVEKLVVLSRRSRPGRWLGERYALVWCLLPIPVGWWIATAFLAAARGWGLDDRLTHDGLSLLVAVLNGILGMAVYRREKLAIEPEERNYGEMAETFAAAHRLLTACAGDLDNEHLILKHAGRAALAEHASWLRAHRERPIEQIAGG